MDLPSTTSLSLLWDVFFPNECLICREDLQYGKYEILCPLCKAQMVVSDSHLTSDHPLRQRLTEWYEFEEVYSKYRFPNGSRIQKLIHHFKYHHLKYVGYLEGLDFGKIIQPDPMESEISFLVPVPLHWYKKFKRGFNQSLVIAQGLSRSTGIPVLKGFLRRKKYTRSQTKLNRQDRLKNMKDAFSLNRKKVNELKPENLQFLLVDDVITSGITLGSAAHAIKKEYPKAKISACSLAYKDYE